MKIQNLTKAYFFYTFAIFEYPQRVTIYHIYGLTVFIIQLNVLKCIRYNYLVAYLQWYNA